MRLRCKIPIRNITKELIIFVKMMGTCGKILVNIYSRDLRYSSNEGAAEMDFLGSASSLASGSRVSAMPPDPSLGSSLLTTTEVRVNAAWGVGAHAAAPAKRVMRVTMVN